MSPTPAAAFCDQLGAAFREAAAGGLEVWTLQLGPVTFRLEFAGPALLPVLGRALAHLRVETVDRAHVTLRVWDTASTGVGRPRLDAPGAQVVRGLVPAWSDARHAVAIEGPHHAVSVWDAAARIGYHHVPSADAVPAYETAFPLRALLSWALAAAGLQLVHAAAVGTAQAAALIVGRGGSGKSGTALAALCAGLRYAGDDYVVMGLSPQAVVYSVYQSAKLFEPDLNHFPALRPALDRVDASVGKAVLFLDALGPDRLANALPLRALLAPRIARAPQTTFTPVPPAVALRALAPSSVLQLPGARAEEFHRMARLAAVVPGFEVALGHDRAEVAAALRTFLEGLQ